MADRLVAALIMGTVLITVSGPVFWGGDEGKPTDGVPEPLGSAFRPPPEFAGDLGAYKSPLVFDDGRPVRNPADWQGRREEILTTWHGIMGSWPPPIERPKVEVLGTERREGFEQRRVRIEVATDRSMDGYLLLPEGEGTLPAVLVVYYEPETAIGEVKELRDFAYQLARRGFVALSLGIDPRLGPRLRGRGLVESAGAAQLHAWAGSEPKRMHQPGAEAEARPEGADLLRAAAGRRQRHDVRFVDGRPVSQVTEDYLSWVCERLAKGGKRALLLVWDNTTWHVSKRVRPWIKGHNRRAKAEGGVRIVSCPLPVKAPWLNRVEPKWVHGKRAIVEPDRPLTAAEVVDRVCSYTAASRWSGSHKITLETALAGWGRTVVPSPQVSPRIGCLNSASIWPNTVPDDRPTMPYVDATQGQAGDWTCRRKSMILRGCDRGRE